MFMSPFNSAVWLRAAEIAVDSFTVCKESRAANYKEREKKYGSQNKGSISGSCATHVPETTVLWYACLRGLSAPAISIAPAAVENSLLVLLIIPVITLGTVIVTTSGRSFVEMFERFVGREGRKWEIRSAIVQFWCTGVAMKGIGWNGKVSTIRS
jgi:hypothetical protein